ncbi:unnamed protein product [Angiostrongylus costaricensis]|uniref:FLZ-type domain-containing protein n=1 Tax=Angiostrongylus costaricensis TaxID=334426 RepID=A0A0R3PTL2_ANGCS|nr:unnamed protein product [Angiostrongylus costaricensis]
MVAVQAANDGKLIKIMNANNVYISCRCCRAAKQHASKHGNFYLSIGQPSRAPVLNDDMPSATCKRENKTRADSNSLYADGTKKIPRLVLRFFFNQLNMDSDMLDMKWTDMDSEKKYENDKP